MDINQTSFIFSEIFDYSEDMVLVCVDSMKEPLYTSPSALAFMETYRASLEEKICHSLQINHWAEICKLGAWLKNKRVSTFISFVQADGLNNDDFEIELRQCKLAENTYMLLRIKQIFKSIDSDSFAYTQELVQKIIDLVPDPFFIKDHQRNFLMVNKKFVEYHDLPLEKILGKKDEEIKPIIAETLPFVKDDLEVIQQNKVKYIPNESYTNAFGEKLILRTTKIPHYFNHLDAIGIIGIAINITDKIHLKHKILNNRKMQRQITDLVPHAIYLKDNQGKYIFVNKEFLKRISKEEHEVIGFTDFDLYSKIKAQKNTNDDLEVIASLKEKVIEKEFGSMQEGSLSIYKTIKQPYFDYETGKVGILGISSDLTEKLKSKELLDQQKSILNEIINLLPHEIYLKDDEGKMLLVNKACADFHQLSQEELMGKTDFDLFDHNYASKFYVQEQNILKDGAVTHIEEEESINRKGELRVKSVIKMPFFLSDRKRNGILGLNIDITENKLAEKKIRESEIRYKTLMEQASDGIYLSDEEGNIISANQKAAEMFGYEIEEFKSLNIKKIVINDTSISKGLRMPYSADKNSLILERKFVKKDGSTFTAELSVKLLEQGKHQAILRDVTERKKLEKVLSDSEKKFRLLIENSSDLILILSSNFIVKYASPSINRILGYTENFMIGNSILNLLEPEDAETVSSFLSQVIHNLEPETHEIKLCTAHQSYLLFETIAVNLLHDENINGIIINCHDITTRKNTENELINTNFELDSFVYKASHDLKAPLRSVMGLIKLARLENKNTELEVYFDMMSKSVTSLDNFIKDLTQFSRNSRLTVDNTEVDFKAVLDETLDNLKYVENAQKIDVKIDLNLTDKFYSDKSRISTILNNLLSNAFKYHRFENNLPFILVKIEANSENAEIMVKDNGIGIEQKHIDYIFDMFYRASEASYGSGLGLYILKNAVQKIKGTIEVVSSFGEGTTFKINIPNCNTSLN